MPTHVRQLKYSPLPNQRRLQLRQLLKRMFRASAVLMVQLQSIRQLAELADLPTTGLQETQRVIEQFLLQV